MTQGPHHVAQTLTRRNFLESLAARALAPAMSMVLRSTGSASHLAKAFFTSSFLLYHLVEQPKTLVFSTATGLSARSASIALRASWEWTVFTSESSMRPW